MVEVPLLVGFDFDNQIVQQKPPPPSFPPSELRPYTTFDYSSLAILAHRTAQSMLAPESEAF